MKCSVAAVDGRLREWITEVKSHLTRAHKIRQELSSLMDDVVRSGQALAHQEIEKALDEWFNSPPLADIKWSEVRTRVDIVELWE